MRLALRKCCATLPVWMGTHRAISMHTPQQSSDHVTDPVVNGGPIASRRFVLKAMAGMAALTASGVGAGAAPSFPAPPSPTSTTL